MPINSSKDFGISSYCKFLSYYGKTSYVNLQYLSHNIKVIQRLDASEALFGLEVTKFCSFGVAIVLVLNKGVFAAYF